jgi:molybdopterin-guanine dinucleotide biosynthesis protein A
LSRSPVSAVAPYTGVILAGGDARRLGGVNKPGIVVGDRRLLDVAIGAVGDATARIGVGPRQSTAEPVRWVRESPPGGGPVAALAAAVPLIQTATVVVLAADLPFVTADAVSQLVNARGTASGVIAVDEDERDQPLLGCYATAALSDALPAEAAGASLRDVISRLESAGEVRRHHIKARIPVTLDCDTPADITRAEELA